MVMGKYFLQGAQKFEPGNIYFRSILYPYLREGLRKGRKFEISSCSARGEMYDPSKEAQCPSFWGCLNIYVPLKPSEVP